VNGYSWLEIAASYKLCKKCEHAGLEVLKVAQENTAFAFFLTIV
jgi:hypothetical protein